MQEPSGRHRPRGLTTLSCALAFLLLALPGAPHAARAAAPQLAAELDALRQAVREGGARWVVVETPLSGLTPEQMRGYLGALETPREIREAMPKFSAQAEPQALPAALDWRSNGGGSYVTGVRNQAGCGSCWAFATTAALESRALITVAQTGEDFDLAEQTLVSCSGAGSCAGGYLGQSAAFLESTGLPTESCHPYTAENGSCGAACADRLQSSYRTQSSLAVDRTVADLKQALVQHGPLPVGMHVFSDFQSYGSGVYSHVSGNYLGGHAVAVVGFDDAAACFIVKNSWGDNWGEGGFFRIAYTEVSTATSFGADALAYGPVIAPVSPISLGEALDNTALAWSTGLAGGWFGQSAVFAYGDDALQSADAAAHDRSWVATSVTGPAEVAFDQRVASNYGTLRFSVDGEDVGRLDYRTTGWRHDVMPLGPGAHALRWTYHAGWADGDAAWLDHVVVGPSAETLTPPAAPTGPAGGGIVGGLCPFETGGAASSLGHGVEYRFDWGDGTRSAWSSHPTAGHVWHVSGTQRVRAQARCASHPSLRTAWSDPLDVAIAPPLPITLAEAVDAPALSFETGGDAPWFAQNATAWAGGDAVQSGHITDLRGDGESWVRTTVNGPGGVRFLWRLSASVWTDLVVSLDGVEQFSTSSVRPWEQRTLAVGPGAHVVTWSYRQDGSEPTRSDCAWLDAVEFLPDYEVIPAPTAPAGRANATVGVALAYTVAPVASNQGHVVEYRFDWGDGTLSDWSADPQAEHAWANPGYRNVKVQARCAAHPLLETAWSGSISVTVSALETVVTPTAPSGPAAVFAGMVATFATGWTDPAALHARQCQFDWGDGSSSTWLWCSMGTLQAGHRWSAAGTYLVRARSRCSQHVDIESPWSGPLSVAVSPLPAIALGEALDAPALAWTTGGAAPWFAQTVDSVVGGSSAQSGALAAGESSWVQTTVTGPAQVSFSWREVAGDFGGLALYVNGSWQTDLSNDAAWGMRVVSLPPGAVTLRWIFAKSLDGMSGEDCARLDQVVVVSTDEKVGRASQIVGPGAGTTGSACAYTASGATSSLGHAVEYRFAWGDGTSSDWSAAASAAHAWSIPGTHSVQAQARCAAHPEVFSEWSYLKPVAIATTAPATPTGPTEGVDSAAYAFTTAGVLPDPGVPLRYSFDWGGSQYSSWSDSPTASRSWSTPGTYQVRARTMPVGDYSCISPWSEPLTVTIVPYEVITQPTLSGPAAGVVRTPYTYTAAGASSSLGHALQYSIYSVNAEGAINGTSSQEITFPYPKTWTVQATVRCAEHTGYQAAAVPLEVVISRPEETLTAPNAPTGPAVVTRGDYSLYACSGAASSIGHQVKYVFDWGDGTAPSSGSTAGSGGHAWSSAGIYPVKVKAVCTLDGGAVSDWSPALAVTVLDPPETISAPTAPVGPAHGLLVGDTGVYTTGGAVSSLGHELEYRLDLFGTPITEWSSLSLVARTWTSSFSGSMRAQARCAAHPTMVSAWSPSLWVIVSQETIAWPGTPGGNSTGIAGQTYEYRVSDPVTVPGHVREYRFDWGDGGVSGWLADTARTHAWPAAGTYPVRVKVRCALHTSVETSWSPSLPVVIRPPNDLAAALDDTALAVETGGDGVWSSQVEPLAFDLDAARSGAVGDSQAAWMRAAVDGPGDVRFSWKVSSAAGDALVAFLDGVELFRISGAVPWEERTVALGAGRHALLWLYRKDGAGSSGEDCGWVDRVVLTTQAEAVAAPAAPTGTEGGVTQVSYAFAAAGALSSQAHALEYRFDWGDGVLSAWSPSPTAEHAWAAPGDYPVVAQARCQSEPGNLSAFSPPTVVAIALLVENVNAPPAPSGTSNAVAGEPVFFTTGGSASDLGHAVEYRFGWGDGSFSPWSADSGDAHAWAGSGVFEVRARARCALHTGMQSPWSEAFLVAVAPPPEETGAPLPPECPAGATTGGDVTCALGGAVSNRGHAVEYRVEWGDGTLSDWGPATVASHSWSAAGRYELRAQARCAADPAFESAWSAPAALAVADHYDIGEAVENTLLAWESGGDAEWFRELDPSASGGDAARSGPLGPSRSASVGTTVEGPTALYFLWRAASVAGKDRLVFRLDGVEQRRITGRTAWLFGAARVAEGTHALEWRFTRGSRSTTVPHAGWLDLVVSEPREIAGTIAVTAPAGGETWKRGQTVTLRWEGAGVIGPAVAVQLQKRTSTGRWAVAKHIARAVPDSGALAWKVPGSLLRGVRYRIRVLSCADPAIAGASAGWFTVR